MAGELKVTLERENCISCGNCWTTCPEFFEESPLDGRSQIISKFRTNDHPSEGHAPEEQEECVRSASGECPAEVIHVD